MNNKNTDKEKATVRQKAPDKTQMDAMIQRSKDYGLKVAVPNMKTDTQTALQPAHSTLPWFTMASPKPDELHPMVSIWSGTETRESIVCNSCTPADAKLIVASVNHADKLAEALRDLQTLAQCTVPAQNIAGHLRAMEHKASKALAEYESDVQR